MVFGAPKQGSHDDHVLSHHIHYDEYIIHGVNNEPIEGVDLVTLLNHRLWRVKTALKTAFDHFVQRASK